MKEFEVKKIFIYVLGTMALFVFVLAGMGLGKVNWERDEDLKIGVFTKDTLGIVSISPRRRMVNTLKLSKDTKVWLPGGYGWYKASKVKELLAAEKKEALKDQIFFYNFGMEPGVIVETEVFEGWQDMGVWAKNIGMFNFLKFRIKSGDMLFLEDEIETEKINYSKVGELLARDFAYKKLVEENIRVGVVNNGAENGVAKWLSDRLEWAGMTVISLETGEEEDGYCFVGAGKTAHESYSYQLINKTLGCQEIEMEALNDEDIEVHLGKEYGAMVKY